LSVTFYLFTINNVDDETGVVKGICQYSMAMEKMNASKRL